MVNQIHALFNDSADLAMAIELSASSDWAGIRCAESIRHYVDYGPPVFFHISCGFCAGLDKLISAWSPDSAGQFHHHSGAIDLRMTSDCHTPSLITIQLPASARPHRQSWPASRRRFLLDALKPSLSNCSAVFAWRRPGGLSWASLSLWYTNTHSFPSV